LGQVEKDCRKAAPKEERVGKTCESNEWERTSQMHQFSRKTGLGGTAPGGPAAVLQIHAQAGVAE